MALTILSTDNVLNRGTVANDNTGDTLRTAGQKINTNFEALDSAVSNQTWAGAASANETLRHNGTAFVATDGLQVDASGNVTVSRTLSSDSASISGDISVTGTVDGRDIAADGTKLDGIESGATADQTGAEIKSLYEAESNTNAFTDTLLGKLNAIEENADVTDTANVRSSGALMDDELTNLSAVKAINQGLTTTSNVTFDTVTDNQANLRALNRTGVTSASYEIPSGSSGKLFTLSGSAATVDVFSSNFSAGDIITIYNFRNVDITLNFGTWSQGVRIAGSSTNYSGSTATLSAYGVCTIIADTGNRIVISGNVA